MTTHRVMMVRPAAFGYNPETAASNAFQRRDDAPEEEIARRAIAEFDGFVARLRDAGVAVEVFDDTPDPHTPDAVFPNNWVSFHEDGTAVLHPMESPTRRLEVRRDIVEALGAQRIVDFTGHAEHGRFLEGTGSLVLDRAHRIAYACLSPRTHPVLVDAFAEALGYEPVTFRSVDAGATEIYHTNVMMSVGTDFAVLCGESIPDADERRAVESRLRDTGHEIIDIDLDQTGRFAGNVLEVPTPGGCRLAMSDAARAAFTPEQTARLEAHARIVSAPLATIETSGGGSARCMLAEVPAWTRDRPRV